MLRPLGFKMGLLALIASLLATPASASVGRCARENAVVDPAVTKIVDDLVRAQMADNRIPGMSVAVVRNGRLVQAAGYGLSNIERGTSVDPATTLFRVGSITKLFTYTAAMQLVEQGLLGLDDDVNGRLSGVQIAPKFGRPVTVNEIMHHRAGFGEGDLGYDFFGNPALTPTLRDFVRDHQLRRVTAPGTRTAYSNYGPTVLGLVIEQTTHQPYEAYLQDHILTPLGMTRTTLREPVAPGLPAPLGRMRADDAARAAVGYSPVDGGYAPIPIEHIFPGASPAGSMFTTANDMACFMLAYLNGGSLGEARILKEETISQMWTRGYSDRKSTVDFAHGFFNTRVGGYDAYQHTGVMAGFTSNLTLIPQLELGIFVVGNSETGWGATSALPGQIVARAFPPGPLTAPIPVVPSDFGARANRFAGIYLTAARSPDRLETLTKLGVEARVTAGDGGLAIAMPGDSRRWIEIAPLTFQDAEGQDRIHFIAAGDRITGFYTPMGHRSYERVDFTWTKAFFQGAMFVAAGLALTMIAHLVLDRRRRASRALAWSGYVALAASLGGLAFAGLFFRAMAHLEAVGVRLAFVWPTAPLMQWVWSAWILAAATLAMTLSLWPVWRGGWPRLRQVHHTALTLALLTVVALAWRWNLFASPYN